MTALLDSPQTTHNPRYSNETFAGEFVDLSKPLPHQFDLESVAAGLSKVCRYAGGPQFFYCVAEHAYWVSKRLEWLGHDVDVQLAGLHHDDAEFVMGDVTTPMKRYLADREAERARALENSTGALLTGLLAGVADDAKTRFIVDAIKTHIADQQDDAIIKELEASLMEVIIPGLGFFPGEIDLEHPAIKNADLWALAGEALQLTKSGGEGWAEIGEYDPHPDLSSIGLSSERAASLWIARHNELLAKLRRLPTPPRHV
jgi:hypothetical protein